MAGFQLTFSTASPGSMVHLSDAQLKGIVHFKLFIAVQGSGETIDNGIDCLLLHAILRHAHPTR